MGELGRCSGCGTSLADHDLRDLPGGEHGLACPVCETDVYCPECGHLTDPIAEADR